MGPLMVTDAGRTGFRRGARGIGKTDGVGEDRIHADFPVLAAPNLSETGRGRVLRQTAGAHDRGGSRHAESR
ncbi:hypothetical protein GCM10010145_53560 [Streptomyces ruber]|uniref:Uncharacterized protein n=2 Tax=Streptomyces TaxID=1883 RepID=A0A918EV57_9ACTN|nr:hypothetical protein GCM10010145_53560 [Streptomyces ruber]